MLPPTHPIAFWVSRGWRYHYNHDLLLGLMGFLSTLLPPYPPPRTAPPLIPLKPLSLPTASFHIFMQAIGDLFNSLLFRSTKHEPSRHCQPISKIGTQSCCPLKADNYTLKTISELNKDLAPPSRPRDFLADPRCPGPFIAWRVQTPDHLSMPDPQRLADPIPGQGEIEAS